VIEKAGQEPAQTLPIRQSIELFVLFESTSNPTEDFKKNQRKGNCAKKKNSFIRTTSDRFLLGMRLRGGRGEASQ